jgi:LysR family transcriptional regulator, carnitine catabolism transcriptional activator
MAPSDSVMAQCSNFHNRRAMTITLRQLRAFSEAYRLRNLTHAADAVHVTQSAMSVLIRQLEEGLGVQLFERTPRALRPTAAADQAYAMARRILEEVDQLERTMREQASGARRQLAFTCTPALACTVVPRAVAEFKQRMPEARVVMHDAADATLIGEVLSEAVEFSVGWYENEPEALVVEQLVIDALAVVCRHDSPLVALPRVTWADLAGQHLIRLTKGAPLRRQIGEAASATGLAFEPDYEVSYLHTALAMIGQGLGVAVLPGYLVRGNPHTGGLVALALQEPVVERSLLVHTRPGHELSEPARVFLGMLRGMLNP